MMEAKLTFGVRGVKGINGKKRRKHELNYAVYKKQTQMLTVVLSVAVLILVNINCDCCHQRSRLSRHRVRCTAGGAVPGPYRQKIKVLKY